jgi:antitoxin MazE
MELKMRVKIAEWGNSLGLRVPKAVADQLGLKAGSEVEMTLEGAMATISAASTDAAVRKPVAVRHLEMVAEMRRLMAAGVLPPEKAEPDLLSWGPDVGAEVIDDGGYPQPTDI